MLCNKSSRVAQTESNLLKPVHNPADPLPNDGHMPGLLSGDASDFGLSEFATRDQIRPNLNTQLSNAITQIELALDTDAFPPELLEKLISILPVIDSTTAVIYDDQFDIRSEVTMQLRFVKALRSDMFSHDGKIKPGYDKEDVKYVLDASKELRKSLEVAHDKYLNFERVQGIVKAFTDVVSHIKDDGIRKQILAALKNQLDSTSSK